MQRKKAQGEQRKMKQVERVGYFGKMGRSACARGNAAEFGWSLRRSTVGHGDAQEDAGPAIVRCLKTTSKAIVRTTEARSRQRGRRAIRENVRAPSHPRSQMTNPTSMGRQPSQYCHAGCRKSHARQELRRCQAKARSGNAA